MLFMIRTLDLFLAVAGLIIASPLLLTAIILCYFDTGSPIFIQTRVGRGKAPFKLIKLRTMSLDTPSVASHLVKSSAVTPLGSFLRKSKFDELPQLVNVIKGDMSLVGPRPGLFNQLELIEERDRYGIFVVRPGITGLAQISGIDMSTPELLAKTDALMIADMSMWNYFSFICQTIKGQGRGDKVANQKNL